MDLFNKNYKNYLDKKEKILLHITNDKSFIFLVLNFLIGTFYAYIIYLMLLSKTQISFGLFLLNFRYPFLFILLYCYLLNKSMKYVITENGIYLICGLLCKRVKFVSYKKITDTVLSVGIIGSWFNLGSIKIFTGSKICSLQISLVKDFNKVNKLIRKYI